LAERTKQKVRQQIELVPPSDLPPIHVGGGDGGGGGERLSLICPFLDGPCVRERCIMWLDRAKPLSGLSEAQRCAVRRGGEAALLLARQEDRKARRSHFGPH
jgi:hypothetical protein